MYKRVNLYLFFILFLSFIAYTTLNSFGQIPQVVPLALPADRISTQKVVLLPLDSRPACTQFIEELGHIAATRVVMPPPELLDHYNQPADKAALRKWLKKAVKTADAAIISTDMLIHGGLLASRLSLGTDDDIKAALDLLTELRQENPAVKLYVFNIIPRLLIADQAASARYQQKLFQYSVLTDQALTFENPLDIKKLNKIKAELPAEVIGDYWWLYQRNNMVNIKLINLAAAGIIDKLVIGQDDGNLFGIPNMSKQYLQHYIDTSAADLKERVFVTRGTDEVGLTLLGRLSADSRRIFPRVYVMYSDGAAGQIVMPFMPHSVATTVREKMAIAGGRLVSSPGEADFLLYVHAGTKNSTPYKLTRAAKEIKTLLEQGYKVAVVDLTEDFFATETLLPALLKENVPVTSLAAYAGWNTTSNSIGTAVTQAALFTAELKQPTTDLNRLYHDQLTFLIARMLDDWYYLKNVQPIVNKELRAVNINPYNLGENYAAADRLIARLMRERAHSFYQQALANQPVVINSGQDKRKLIINNLTLTTKLPWERTFEIRLDPQLSLAELH